MESVGSPWWLRPMWAVRDYASRLWDNVNEDNVLFLAGGIAFNILLAAIPFVLLLVAGLTYALPAITDLTPQAAIHDVIDRLLPLQANQAGSWVHGVVDDMIRTRGSVTIWSAFLFAFLSTRLFGSLRTALAEVFDIEQERSILRGKLFDLQITVVGTILFVASTLVTAYLALATSRGLSALQHLGLQDDVMTGLEYWMGRSLAFVFITLMFFALYKYLPVRKVRTRTAWLAAGVAGLAFEAARQVFRVLVAAAGPKSIYTGAITALVIVVVWVYYAALIFLLAGEIGQVYELRRTQRLQREVFT